MSKFNQGLVRLVVCALALAAPSVTFAQEASGGGSGGPRVELLGASTAGAPTDNVATKPRREPNLVGRTILGASIGAGAGASMGAVVVVSQLKWTEAESCGEWCISMPRHDGGLGSTANIGILAGSTALGALVGGLIAYATTPTADEIAADDAERRTTRDARVKARQEKLARRRARASWTPTFGVSPDGSGASVGLTAAF